MVLSHAIIFNSVVFVCEQRHSKGCRFLLNLKVYCLVLVEVRGGRKSIIVHRKI